MPKYTIQNVMPTGESHDMYGTEYYVKFAESEETFKLWYKTKPEEGQEVEGDIDGSKFKKAKKEFVSNQTRTGQSAPRQTYSAIQKDKNDGQRQGMCFNNASSYVEAISPSPLPPKQWASAVKEYAQALYNLGDLTFNEPGELPVTQVEEVSIDEAPKAVKDIFASPANASR